jgi:hypothetical protein
MSMICKRKWQPQARVLRLGLGLGLQGLPQVQKHTLERKIVRNVYLHNAHIT